MSNRPKQTNFTVNDMTFNLWLYREQDCTVSALRYLFVENLCVYDLTREFDIKTQASHYT